MVPIRCVVLFALLALTFGACAHKEVGPTAGGPRAPYAAPPPTAVAYPSLALLMPEEQPLVDPTPARIPAPAAACREEMVLVEGEYCTEVRQDCVEYMEPPTNKFARCAKFAPSVCTGTREHKRFCIDKDEYVPPGQSLPQGNVSWRDARSTCEAMGKRLCMETEWQFACEGEDMLPYPYGLERDGTRCNQDLEHVLDDHGKLLDLRRAPAELARCTSPFGVRSMTGNVDEWVYRDYTNGDWRSALKGGWWMPARNRCRPATTAHNEWYTDVQTGFRCCSDAASSSAPPAAADGSPNPPVESWRRNR